MMANAKKCPICGGRRVIIWRTIARKWKPYHAECRYCHFCTKRAHTRRGAIRQWNKATAVVAVCEGVVEDG